MAETICRRREGVQPRDSTVEKGMFVRTPGFFLVAVLSGVVGGVFMTGCSSGSDNAEPPDTDSGSADTGAEDGRSPVSGVTGFDGSWRTDCTELRTFGVPEDEPPDGYVQRTLTLDGGAGTYAERRRFYTDSGCSIEDSGKPSTGVSGRVRFEGTTTTGSGMEATVVRYVSDAGGPPDLVGLLYRDADVLYRELRQSTLIDDTVPEELALSVPWRLVD